MTFSFFNNIFVLIKSLLCKSIFTAFFLFCFISNLFAQIPNASFTVNTTSGCSPLTVNFTDLSTGSPLSWFWNFGNGNTSTLQNPGAVYTNPGTYTVTLSVSNTNGGDIVTKTDYITVYKSPASNFNSNVTSGCKPLSVQFTDISDSGSSNIITWFWNFGDGNSSTASNPLNTYNASGNYNVSLTITNSNGCNNTLTKQGNINVFDKPQANFTAASNTGCTIPLIVDFLDQSTQGSSAIISWDWKFGDGFNANTQNINHTYSSFGKFDVELLIVDANNCSSLVSKDDFVIIDEFKSDFSRDTAISCPNLKVSFHDSSSPNPVSWLWSFGDGNTSAVQNPIYNYSTSGNFTVTLISSSSIGCKDTVVKTNNVYYKRADAAFVPDSMDNCNIPFTINFANNSTGEAPLKFYWDFDDLSPIDSSISPSHTYTSEADTYKVSLTMVDAWGCRDSLRMFDLQDSIVIDEPNLSAVISPNSGCIPLIVNFFDASTSKVSPITAWQWNFGDPISGANNTSTLKNPIHNYDSTGTYTVKLITITARGCIDSINYNVVSGTPPVTVDFSASDTLACHGEPVQLNDLSTDTINNWFWLIGDGTSYLTKNIIHLFQDTGYVTFRLIAGFNGCNDTIIDSIYILPPKPLYTVSKYIICSLPYDVTFSDLSFKAATWLWDFGDNSTSTDTNPTHTYTIPGIFNTKLVVTNSNGCKDSIGFPIIIPDIKIGFGADDTASCFSLAVNFDDTSKVFFSPFIKYWAWDLGDSTKYFANYYASNFKFSDINPPAHTYSDTGKYNITLMVVEEYGCTASLTKTAYLTVNGVYPNFSADKISDCVPHTVNFSDLTSGTAPAKAWVWNFGDGNPNDTIQNPAHTYNSRGNYNVLLSVTDSNNCTNSIQKTNYIQPTFPYPFFSNKTPICINENIGFTNATTGTGLKFIWDFGDTQTDSLQNPSHSYADSGLYTVTLTAIDTNNCDSVFTNVVTVMPFPVASFFVDALITDCPPLIVNFTDSSSNDAITWNWSFGDGNTSTVKNPVYSFAFPDTFDITLIVTNSTGCKDTLSNTGLIKVGGPKGTFTFTPVFGCIPLKVNFSSVTTNTIKFTWDFGDGNVDSVSGDSSVHIYTEPGNPIPFLLISDPFGCELQAAGPTPSTVTIDDPVTSFTLDNTILCDLDTVSFNDVSFTKNTNTTIASRSWNFGDSIFSTQQNPQHFYSDSGTFIVTLTTVNSIGCTTSNTATVKVFIKPNFNIGVSDYEGCIPFNAVFYDSTVYASPASTIAWDFGDGSPVNASGNTSHIYDKSGVYQPKFIVIYGDEKCMEWIYTNQFIKAYDVPQANFDLDSLQSDFKNKKIFFSNYSIINGSVGTHEYFWNFGDFTSGNKNFSINEHPYHTFSNYGEYTIQLIVTNEGCSDTIYRTFKFTYTEEDNDEEFKIPNFFTPYPTSEGKNDLFFINGLNNNSELMVYNRWGKMVYKSYPYQNNWDGSEWNGSILTTDTYYYIFKDKTNKKTYNGFIYIIRE